MFCFSKSGLFELLSNSDVLVFGCFVVLLVGDTFLRLRVVSFGFIAYG